LSQREDEGFAKTAIKMKRKSIPKGGELVTDR
jgi:hypothetical protein